MAEGADIASGRLRSEEYARNFADLVPPLDQDGALVEAAGSWARATCSR
jgi:hypothetical protein